MPITNVASPVIFILLYFFKETKDFELPQGLPVTPRMLNKGVDPNQVNMAEQHCSQNPANAKFPSEVILPIIRIQNHAK